MKTIIFSIQLAASVLLLNAQPYATWKTPLLILDNGMIKRIVSFTDDSVTTRQMNLKGNDFNFIGKCDKYNIKRSCGTKEFSFLIDNKMYNGYSGWQFVSFTEAKDDHQGKGAVIRLKGKNEINQVEIEITYILYPDLPVIRKQITVFNTSAKEIKLESLDIEKIQLGYGNTNSVCYTNYGRMKHLGTYVGNWDDALVANHCYDENKGILLGNEAPGVLKRTDFNTEWDNIDIGLTHTDDPYPFRKWIKPGESWTSPRVFIIPYVNKPDPWTVMNTTLAEFQRKYMGLKIYENKKLPTFMYNNYNPFRDNFNDTLLISLARSAAQCGIRQFEIDCGWHINTGSLWKKEAWADNCGDWIVDKTKFPDGLQPVIDEIRKLGMEPGLWISVGTASTNAQVYKDHPEWMVQGRDGKPDDLHSPWEKYALTACHGTDYNTYIKEKILGFVKEYNLAFLKLDLTVATSAYTVDTKRSGCYAKDHPYHKDWEESFIIIYTRLFELFDELHKAAPQLYIDCTFETEGKLQLIDYAFCEHAECNWLTNIENPYPVGTYRIRDLAWWKCPVMPASSMIICNLRMDDKDFVEELKTLLGTFPIVLGDPRVLIPEKKAEIKQWGDWMVEMQKKYNYLLYRQDLPAFVEPVEVGWDAWSRINTDDKTGGIVGVFKQASLDDSRTVSIPGLDKNILYSIKSVPDGKEILRMTGKELEEKGITVKLEKKYDSQILEISSMK